MFLLSHSAIFSHKVTNNLLYIKKYKVSKRVKAGYNALYDNMVRQWRLETRYRASFKAEVITKIPHGNPQRKRAK